MEEKEKHVLLRQSSGTPWTPGSFELEDAAETLAV